MGALVNHVTISRREKFVRRSVEFILACSGFLSVLVTLGVLYILISKTWIFFKQVPLSAFFLDTVWTPLFSSQRFGIWSLVLGSMLVTTVAMLTAGPFGILAAIYMSEFAHSRIRKILKPLLEILAGIPTVVYGYFALTMVTPALQLIIPGLNGFNALSPGLVLGLMLIPTVSSLCEDALFTTPRDLKEAAYSLGARKLSTIFLVTLPYSRSTIIAALFLAFGRAMGETMIVAIAAGMKAHFTFDVREPIQTMTAYIVQVSMGDTPQNSIEYLTIFTVGTMLFVITFIFHAGSRLILRSKFKAKS
jgi:phosphate transport system permease protein